MKNTIEIFDKKVIEANILKSKYTNDLNYNISISKVKNSQNTRLVQVQIFKEKQLLFNTMKVKALF